MTSIDGILFSGGDQSTVDSLVIQNNISNLRAILDLSYAKFGSLFGNTSAPAALNWENGESIPPKTKLQLIADFCGVSIEDFSSRFLSDKELEVIKSLYYFGDTIVYLGSEPLSKKITMDSKFNFSSVIYLGFNEGKLKNAFDIKTTFTYDPAYPSTITVNFVPIFNSINEKFLLDFNQLLGRYIYVSNRKHFEKVMFDSIYVLYGSLISSIKQEVRYSLMPVYEEKEGSYEDYQVAYQQWKDAMNTELDSNLLLFSIEYKDYEKLTFYWPHTFFYKDGKDLFNDYLELKYN